ncbi:MAG: phosphoenolpyruvate carboxykinase (GTP) [Fibromonadaceae bacterium]|jgi:phosphoenolpyruvate carboxykinase (GTP)|nr:phosphoenolpyruvate carboxykinase (GTP) [Fibromonadaceae bacterium]
MSNSPTNHAKLNAWVKEIADLVEPANIYWADGSKAEYDQMIKILVDAGLATPLKKRPNSFLFRSDPSDVARAESRTFIASQNKDDAGPYNNWINPAELKEKMRAVYKGCMKGRTMYVIPFSMGPIGSPIAKIGVEISDSPYVVVNMQIMTRVGTKVLEVLGTDGEFIPCLHSVGKPLAEGQTDGGKWPCEPDVEKKYISHFPEERTIWSFGSGYGGNALLGKKCLALRIASIAARDEGWLAEHMLILKMTREADNKFKYIAAAFPSACGKTNLAMLIPTIPGWKVECIGDDIAWMKIRDGKLYAINPEAGFFGVGPGTSMHSNPNAMLSIKENTIFSNAALTEDGDIWWEGIGYDAPGKLIDWKGREWIQDKNNKDQEPSAHANARFTVPARQCPVIAPEWEDPNGVPIDAILFGGRRASVIPLIHQAKSWNHGVFIGSIAGSEITGAALDLKVGSVRRDPMAMVPFCGYHMGDYLKHWVEVGKNISEENQPKFFFVNWFRKKDGKFMWPGFGENSRVLKWVFEQCDGSGKAVDTPIGLMPEPSSIDRPSDVSEETLKELLAVDIEGWKAEIKDVRENHYAKLEPKLPKELAAELDAIEKRLG